MAFSFSFDTATSGGLLDLNTFLQSRSYVVGFQPSQTDNQLFTIVAKAPDAATYPNVARYFSHISSFAADVRAQWPAAFGAQGGKPAKTAAVPAKAAAPAPKAAAEDDDADLFGDDGDAAAAAAAAKVEKPVVAEVKKVKKEEISKTAVIYEVKPLEAGQDMKAMETAIREIIVDGIFWGEEFKVVDVAYGIQKLIVQAVIEDEKILLQDIEDRFEALTEIIQSFDMLSMNKVSGK